METPTTPAEFLDMIQAETGLPSDYALAKRTGLPTPEISRIRQGERPPTDRHIIALCELANIAPDRYLLLGNAWRSKEPGAKAVYTKLAGSITAGFLVAATLSLAGTKVEQTRMATSGAIHYATFVIVV